MLATLLDRDNFLGRILTGRIESGTLNINDPIRAMDVNGKVIEDGRVTKLFAFQGLERLPVETAKAGDIVAIAGLMKATVSNTIGTPQIDEPLHGHALSDSVASAEGRGRPHRDIRRSRWNRSAPNRRRSVPESGRAGSIAGTRHCRRRA